MLQINHSMSEKQTDPADQTPNPQVLSKARRRTFSDTYKLSILEQADQCQGSGEVGALLRREGLYSSHLSTWRQLRRDGMLQALKGKKRGPKTTQTSAHRQELEQLRRRNAKLERELEKAHTIIDVQKKLSSILAAMPDDDETSS
jgi:transposase